MPIKRYGHSFPDGTPDLAIEACCFKGGGTEHKGGLSKAEHFKNITSILWGRKNKVHFKWHPWADDMLEEACRQKWLSLSGSTSCGKSRFGAAWGIVNWLCAPASTSVLLTSTCLKDARRRIWGDVVELFTAAPGLPGKLVDSVGMVRTWDGVNRYSDKSGLHLITGEKSKEKENIGKLIGFKSPRVFLIGDELPELSPALVEAAQSNLIANPTFQMIGIGNFKSIYDPFGTFSEPEHGWGSVTPDHERWNTKNGGVCLRFDGLKSPNVLAGKDIWPIYGNATLREQKHNIGEHTQAFWRMCRSFPCPEAYADRIYSEADLIKGKVKEFCKWENPPILVAFLDPAFVSGGDKAIVYFGKHGLCTDGIRRLEYTERVELKEDMRKRDESRSLQVAKGYRDACVHRGVSPENAGYDYSGGGTPFGALLAEIWSPRCYGLQFGGAPTQRRVSSKDPRVGKDAYANRVSEIWYVGLEFTQSDQLRGVTKEIADDWKERKYETTKGGNGLKIKVEPKVEMKERIGRSPDDGDSALGLLDLCRERHGFLAGGLEGKAGQQQKTWKMKARLVNSVYSPEHLYQEEAA